VKKETGEEDRLFKPADWAEYNKLDKAKKVIKKGAVAMLTPDQKAWARSFLPKVTPMFGKAANVTKFLDLAEFKAKKEAARAE
jgi:hypothetical protein